MSILSQFFNKEMHGENVKVIQLFTCSENKVTINLNQISRDGHIIRFRVQERFWEGNTTTNPCRSKVEALELFSQKTRSYLGSVKV